MSCGVGRRHGSDLALLWLWHRPVATAPVGPLAWKPPYAAGVALKRQKDRKKKKTDNGKVHFWNSTLKDDRNRKFPYGAAGQGSGTAVSCGVGHRHSSDPPLLWLWCRPVATAPVGPLAWKPLYATTWMNPENMLSKRNQAQKATYYTFPFI